LSDNLNILIAPSLSFISGLFLGIILEKYRERKRYYQQVFTDYRKAMVSPTVSNDDYLRFGALQRAGIWRLSSREMSRLADEVKGCGLPNPFDAWVGLSSQFDNYPKGLFDWAKKEGVDLADAEATLRKMAQEFDEKNLPKPPEGAGMVLLD